MAASHFLGQSAARAPARSALQALRRLAEHAEAPEALRGAASRLTTHVTEVHALPHPEDPLADARVVIEGCLGQHEIEE